MVLRKARRALSFLSISILFWNVTHERCFFVEALARRRNPSCIFRWASSLIFKFLAHTSPFRHTLPLHNIIYIIHPRGYIVYFVWYYPNATICQEILKIIRKFFDWSGLGEYFLFYTGRNLWRVKKPAEAQIIISLASHLVRAPNF